MAVKKLFSGTRKFFWVCLVLVAALDQFTKFLFFSLLSFETPLVVAADFFNIVRRTNPAAAFSLGPEGPAFYIIATLAAMVLLIWLLNRTSPEMLVPAVGLGLTAGGVLGNLIDRIYMGEVRDFLDFHWFGRYHWPAFNVADAAICMGAAIVLLGVYRGHIASEPGSGSACGNSTH